MVSCLPPLREAEERGCVLVIAVVQCMRAGGNFPPSLFRDFPGNVRCWKEEESGRGRKDSERHCQKLKESQTIAGGKESSAYLQKTWCERLSGK